MRAFPQEDGEKTARTTAIARMSATNGPPWARDIYHGDFHCHNVE